MKDRNDLPQHADLIARALCLVMAAAWAAGAGFAHAAGSAWFWLLAGASTVFAVVGLFGPRSLRTALIGWFW
jgi:hypothetical protein